jgi:hypothetical protein
MPALPCHNPGMAQETPEPQYHNAILFGAGSSYDAGIPLLPSFVDTMWQYAIREKIGEQPLSPSDLEILKDAQRIRLLLGDYANRAYFDNYNIEDVLSLLDFQALQGEEYQKNFEKMVQAVSRTIELSCRFKYTRPDKRSFDYDRDGPAYVAHPGGLYRMLWTGLLDQYKKRNPIALFTFNYDLVLERTLADRFFVSKTDADERISDCALRYFFPPNDFVITPMRVREGGPAVPGARFVVYRPEFYHPRPDEKFDIEIPYFKLHGSLNWDRSDVPGGRPKHVPVDVAQTPLILPPVFNKMKDGTVNRLWASALKVLREAKHIVIVGYSLPRTDIYMQYFLKSAVGPNNNLQRLTVFNPVLFRNDKEAEEMRSRFRECFSPQFSKKIDFQPHVPPGIHITSPPPLRDERGKLEHFVALMHTDPRWLFFMP